MQLYYQRYPDNDADGDSDARPPLLIIPGLFGSTANWRTVARSIGENHPVWVIDQRNHGRSPHASSNTYADMCDDLLKFMDQHRLSSIVPCGHSMGGKVAMLFSLLHPDRVAGLVVLDIAPIAYNHSHAPFLEELMRVDLSSLTSRGEADRALQAAIPDKGTRLFLLQNLTGSAGQYRWRINLSVLHQYMNDLTGFPVALVENLQYTKTALFINGERSDYLQASHHPLIVKLFAHVRFASISGAGHWLHAEQPEAIVKCLDSFLKELY